MIEQLNQAASGMIAYFINSKLLFALIVGVSITCFFIAAYNIINSLKNPVRRQMRDLSLVGDSTSRKRSSDILDNSVLSLQRFLLPKSEKEIYQTRKRLATAGLRRDSDLVYYYFSKIILSLICGIAALLLSSQKFELAGTEILFAVCLGFAVGMIIPSYILDKKIARRKMRIINGFPDMLDLLVACSEAGLGLNSAIQRVSKEIHLAHRELAWELKKVNSEMLAGVDRIEALKGLSQRTEIEEISGFVAMLCQSVRFGTGIAETLRIYADEFRDKRMQRAEEAAQKVGTKLLFPLVLCMFPSFFIVAVGPAAISIVKAFGN